MNDTKKKVETHFSVRKHNENNRNLNGLMSQYQFVYKPFASNSLYL